MGCCRVAELRHKEVIDRKSGCRLGYVDDVEIDTVSARLMSIIIYGRPKFFGLFGRCEDFVIRWDNIELIGEDTIIVKQNPIPPKHRKSRFNFPFLNIVN